MTCTSKNTRSAYWRAIQQAGIEWTAHHKHEPVEWGSRFNAMHVAAGNALRLQIPTSSDCGLARKERTHSTPRLLVASTGCLTPFVVRMNNCSWRTTL